jgi:hypothetical protein
VTSLHSLEKLHDLIDLFVEKIIIRVLASSLFKDVDNVTVQSLITNSIGFDTREEIVNESSEQRYIFIDELWHVHISEGSHQHDVFWEVRERSLKLTGHDKYGLKSSKTEIIMILLGELLFGKLVKYCHLFGEHLGLGETFRHEHVLANEEKIWYTHGNWSEESLEVIWEFGSTGVTWVHGNIDTNRWNEPHVSSEEIDLLLSKTETVLDHLDLGRYDREYLDIDSVELIEATPETSLNKTRENDTTGDEIHGLTTVGNNASQGKTLGEILDGLCLSCTSWSCRSTSKEECEGSSKSHDASISQRSNDESSIETLILIAVGEATSALSDVTVVLL